MHHNETYIFLDIEAALIHGKQYIIEIGAIKWSPTNKFETFQQLIKPSKFKKLNRHIQSLTGITTEQLLTAPSFLSVIQNFIKWCSGDEGEKVLVTFGEFDRKILEEEFTRHHLNKDFLYPIVDYQQKYMIEHQLKNQPSLYHLLESLNIEIEQQHRALEDAKSLLKIFNATNGMQLIENQKTNHFTMLLSDMIQKEEVYEVCVSYISGTLEGEHITINEVKSIKGNLPFQIREVEKITVEGDSSVVQVHDIQHNEDIQRFLKQFIQQLESKVLITLTGLKNISKIVRLHGVSIPKIETLTLRQILKDEHVLNQFKITGEIHEYEVNILQQIEKIQTIIVEEFGKRNLLKNEVKI